MELRAYQQEAIDALIHFYSMRHEVTGLCGEVLEENKGTVSALTRSNYY